MKKKIEFKFDRTIPAPPSKVFDAWLDPKTPGTPWNIADKYILNPKVDGMFFWRMRDATHYRRFTKLDRPGRIQSTWVSQNTMREESTVTVTFKKTGEGTSMTLVHSGLPDNAGGRTHEKGWTFFLSKFCEIFDTGKRK